MFGACLGQPTEGCRTVKVVNGRMPISSGGDVKQVLGAALLLSWGCSSQPETSAPSKDASSELATCHREAVAYYEAIGSYPTLSTGKPAEDLIAEKCAFNPTMFHDMPL